MYLFNFRSSPQIFSLYCSSPYFSELISRFSSGLDAHNQIKQCYSLFLILLHKKNYDFSGEASVAECSEPSDLKLRESSPIFFDSLWLLNFFFLVILAQYVFFFQKFIILTFSFYLKFLRLTSPQMFESKFVFCSIKCFFPVFEKKKNLSFFLILAVFIGQRFLLFFHYCFIFL